MQYKDEWDEASLFELLTHDGLQSCSSLSIAVDPVHKKLKITNAENGHLILASGAKDLDFL